MNCWEILGIEPTDNLRDIKRAYAAKSREVHPEEHPEEFKALHEAYELALALAKRQAIPTVVIAPEAEPQDAVETAEGDDIVERVETATVEEQGYIDWRAPQNVDDEDYIDFDGIFQKSDIEHNREVVRCSNVVFEKFGGLLASGEKSDLAWTSVFRTEEFGFAADSPYFLSRMTEFVRDNDTLPKCFYHELGSLYQLSAIATRERQGIFEDLISIVIERNMLIAPQTQTKANRVEAWAYTIFGIIFIAVQVAARNYDSTPMWVYYIFLALIVIFFIVITVAKRRDKKKAKKTEEEERIEEIEKKEYRKNRLDMGPIHHIMKPMYYSRLTLSVWSTLFSLGLLQTVLEYEDEAAVVIAFFALSIGGIMLAICLLTNLISFIRHKVSKVPIYVPPLTADVKKMRKNLFRILACITLFFLVMAFVFV
ncbi:MAG: J domain-containing protein [Clostridia bacterium]|nr:J domain-containing protein [Clostridia bacterium]